MAESKDNKPKVFVGDTKVSKLKAIIKYFKQNTLRASVTTTLIILLIVVVGFFGLKFFIDQRNKNNERKNAYAVLVKDVNNLRLQNKNNDAKQELLHFNQQHPDLTKEQRLWIASQLSTIYSTIKDYKESLKWQEIAVQNSASTGFSEYMALAEAYKNVNDYDNAIKYYKLALTALDSTGDNVPKTAYKTQINYLIKKLESKSK